MSDSGRSKLTLFETPLCRNKCAINPRVKQGLHSDTTNRNGPPRRDRMDRWMCWKWLFWESLTYIPERYHASSIYCAGYLAHTISQFRTEACAPFHRSLFCFASIRFRLYVFLYLSSELQSYIQQISRFPPSCKSAI